MARKAQQQQPVTPPGWYADPGGEPLQRYFDGTAWTDHTQPMPDLYQQQMMQMAQAQYAAQVRSANNTGTITTVILILVALGFISFVIIMIQANST